MQNVAKTAPQAGQAGDKKNLKERAVSELERYAVISAYLWILFALFGLHRQLLQGHGISVWQQGFAIVNALVFGKVMLIGEALELGNARGSLALAWVVLRKSLLFAILSSRFTRSRKRSGHGSRPSPSPMASPASAAPAGVRVRRLFLLVLIPFYAFQETVGSSAATPFGACSSTNA